MVDLQENDWLDKRPAENKAYHTVCEPLLGNKEKVKKDMSRLTRKGTKCIVV